MKSHTIILYSLLSIIICSCSNTSDKSEDNDENVSVRELPAIPAEDVKVFTM